MLTEAQHCDRAESYYYGGNLVACLKEYCKALVQVPACDRAVFAVPLLFLQLEKVKETCLWSRRMAELRPESYPYQMQSAELLIKFKQLSWALKPIYRAIILNPGEPRPLVLALKGRLASSLTISGSTYLVNVLKINPACHDSRIFQAISKIEEEGFEAGIDILAALKNEVGDSGEIYYQLGRAYFGKKAIGLATRAYEAAVALDPGNFDYSFTLSSCYFLQFRFARAWKYHDNRVHIFHGRLGGRAGGVYLQASGNFLDSNKNKRILVWGDEGIGDEIKYGMLLSEILASVNKLAVQMDRRLIPLFRRSLPRDVEFFSRGVVISEAQYDNHIAIGSLGRYLRPNLESFSGRGGKFLYADSRRIAGMRAALDRQLGERVVGISWRSNNPETGAARTLALRDLAQRLHAPNVRLVNLQYGEVDGEIEALRLELGIIVWRCPELDTTQDLDGLAALIEVCDEVISIGNSTAHLAGALGKKTTVILRESPQWRWLDRCGQSVWYQSVRIVPWSAGVLYD